MAEMMIWEYKYDEIKLDRNDNLGNRKISTLIIYFSHNNYPIISADEGVLSRFQRVS